MQCYLHSHQNGFLTSLQEIHDYRTNHMNYLELSGAVRELDTHYQEPGRPLLSFELQLLYNQGESLQVVCSQGQVFCKFDKC